MRFPTLIDWACKRFPENEAIVFKERRLTYSQLGKLVNDFSKALLDIGVEKDTKIAIWMPNHPNWIVSKYAISKTGGIMVPINPRSKLTEVEYFLKQSDTHTLILMDNFLTKKRKGDRQIIVDKPGPQL